MLTTPNSVPGAAFPQCRVDKGSFVLLLNELLIGSCAAKQLAGEIFSSPGAKTGETSRKKGQGPTLQVVPCKIEGAGSCWFSLTELGKETFTGYQPAGPCSLWGFVAVVDSETFIESLACRVAKELNPNPNTNPAPLAGHEINTKASKRSNIPTFDPFYQYSLC